MASKFPFRRFDTFPCDMFSNGWKTNGGDGMRSWGGGAMERWDDEAHDEVVDLTMTSNNGIKHSLLRI